MRRINDILTLMRPKHWIKNILVFFPLIFGMKLLEFDSLFMTVIGFISFCLIASSIYIINDIKDVEKDKKHEIKKNRPIASDRVSIKEAIIVSVILIIISILLNVFVIHNFISLGLILLYLILNIFYSFGFKNIPIIDVIILVSGFVIRVVYGASVSHVKISKWLYLTIMSGSFFMGFGKRRNEIIKQGNSARMVLKFYTKDFLDKFMYVCLILALMFYSLWSTDLSTTEKFGEIITYTIPLVIVICMKYCLNIESDSFGDPVDVITSDKILMLLVILFGLSMLIIMYARCW